MTPAVISKGVAFIYNPLIGSSCHFIITAICKKGGLDVIFFQNVKHLIGMLAGAVVKGHKNNLKSIGITVSDALFNGLLFLTFFGLQGAGALFRGV